MKKLFLLIVIVVGGVYGIGMVNLSELGANRFLNTLEELSLQGKGKEYCARLHDDLEVSVEDNTGDTPAVIEGGKQEFCEYVSKAAMGMSLLGISTNVTRNDFTVERSWLHPWTAHVTYNEERTTTIGRLNTSVESESEDKLTLVQTFGGVKLRRLESSAWLVE